MKNNLRKGGIENEMIITQPVGMDATFAKVSEMSAWKAQQNACVGTAACNSRNRVFQRMF